MNKKPHVNKVLLLFTVFLAQIAFAQEKTVTGTITDENDAPLPGVAVKKPGAGGTNTDFDGNYSIDIEVGETLEFSYVGYATQSVTVTEAQDEYNLQMEISENIMDEVLVTAYGESTRESLTGSISSVKSEDFARRAISNVTSALEGSAPGIQFNSSSGTPGSSGSVRIRGFSTINGSNSPLYVIDGVPFSGNMDDLNPNDIEEMSVLKDASATALYGNRASNGVIIIKTKSGTSGSESALNVSVKQGLYNRSIPEYDRIGPDEFMETMWSGYRNALMTDDENLSQQEANEIASNQLVEDQLKTNIYDVPNDELFDENGKLNSNANILPGYLEDLDWLEGFKRTGYRQEYNVNATNSNDKGGIYYSVGYLNEEGYVKTTEFDRINARVNGDYQATNWLKFGTNLSASYQERDVLNSGDFKNPFIYARHVAPIYPVHLHDVETGEYELDDQGEKIYDEGDKTREQYVGRHVVWENELDKARSYRKTLQGQVYADFNFLKDFTLTIKGDLSIRNSELRTYNNELIGDGAGNNGRGKREMNRYKNYTAQQLLTWKKSFGDHNIDILAGHENYSDQDTYLYGYKTDQTFPGKMDLINFTEITDLYDYINTYTTESYLSRAKYNFDRKYYVEGSFRRDGSSRFSKDRRWGDFWSLGGSWIITKEDFMMDNDWIDNLKFRASYGEVGHDSGASRYSYQTLYTLKQNDNTAAVYKTQNAAEDLIWETSSQFGAGLEGRVFDRANFTLEYFDKRSQNLLFDINLPLSTGSTSTGSAKSTVTKNLGTISNTGIELALDVDVVNSQDWYWNVGLNATWMKNKIVRLPEENRENGIVSGNKKRVEGRSIYDFWTYQFAGVDQMNGNSLYLPDTEDYNINGSNPDAEDVPEEYLYEINGDYYVTNTTYAEKDWSGTSVGIPDVYGSFTTDFSWKNLSLSALLTYSLGGKVNESSYSSLMSMSGTPGAMHKDILNSWDGVPEGMTKDSPDRIDPDGTPVVDFSRSTYTNASSDRFLKDGSYLIVKNITLSYGLPQNLLDKIDLKSFDINLGVENLATFTKLKGMNPQYSFSGSSKDRYVPFRTFTLGVNIGI